MSEPACYRKPRIPRKLIGGALAHIRINQQRRSPAQNPAQPTAFLWIEERSRSDWAWTVRPLV
jgi:hypothetical protein